jgi:hypothetical protein
MISTFLKGKPDGEIKGFTYEKINVPAFDVIGFTEPRDGKNEELFGVLLETGKMDALKEMNPIDKRLYRISSWDNECSKHGYRITIGVEKNKNFKEMKEYGSELFSIHMNQSDYIIFDLGSNEPVKNYDNLLQVNYYNLIDELGYKLNPAVGLTIDVFQYILDGQYFETWIPVVLK